jgi:hypothetical protein
MAQQGPMGANGGHGGSGYEISSGSNLLHSLIACSGCGVIFKKSKIIAPAVDPSAYKHITCPVCLQTQGWEPIE